MKSIFILLVFVFPTFVFSEIKLPAFFSDGMILQRDKKIAIWGWANKGDIVRLEFAGQVKTAKTPRDGKWMIWLDPIKASKKNRSLIITIGNETKTIQDILVGEVWLASGQSNMEWTLEKCLRKAREKLYQSAVEYNKEQVKKTQDPLLRQFTVKKMLSFEEKKEDVTGMWMKAEPESIKKFSAVAFYFARELRKELDVPVGILLSAWGGTRVQPWIAESDYKKNKVTKKYLSQAKKEIKKSLQSWEKNKDKLIKEYKLKLKQNEEAKKQGKKVNRLRRPSNPIQNKQNPSVTFNAMIHPLVPYTIKGIIWYQGESNQKLLPKEYSLFKKVLIESWRELWQTELPFYYCQLASYGEKSEQPMAEDTWAEVKWQQTLTMKLPKTGMVVTSDLGEAKDIHPRNKFDVGKRLAAWALAKDYGIEMVYSGPIYKSYELKRNKVLLDFKHVGSGLMVGKKIGIAQVKASKEKLKLFQILGEDNKWYWADAEIVEGKKVAVSHPNVTKPREVRYAYTRDTDEGNLYNKEGFPLGTFKAFLSE